MGIQNKWDAEGSEETDRKRTGTFDVHEERIRGLHKTLEFVLLLFVLGGRVKEIDGESLHHHDRKSVNHQDRSVDTTIDHRGKKQTDHAGLVGA